MQKQKGFTLIEIAIVLVIIGLLLGGVLKGQELITSARVRNIITQQDGIKAAFFGFQDRYRALPGDYAQATTNITNALGNGNGNGIIEAPAAGTNETIAAWDHLSHAGFITGSFVYNATQSEATTPKNPYNAYLQIIHDGVYASATASTGNTTRLNLKTGNQIPVEIMVEIDRKIDDANAERGVFRFSQYLGAGAAPTAANCYTASGGTAAGEWKTTGGETNCGGASLF